jgi:hypothetical protein
MTENDPQKTRRIRSPSSRTRKRDGRRSPGQDTPGSDRLMNTLTGMLPDGVSPRGKRIVVISATALLALISLVVIAILVAAVTDRYDQFLTIIAAEILIVGAVTAAAVIFTLAKHGK